MILKQMVLVLETDSGMYSNTFLTKQNLLRRNWKGNNHGISALENSHLQEHITFVFQNLECLLRISFSADIAKVLSMQEN